MLLCQYLIKLNLPVSIIINHLKTNRWLSIWNILHAQYIRARYTPRHTNSSH